MAADMPHSAVTWDESGAPRSRRHGDIYFSRDDGLAESRAVFLAGCGLPEAWKSRRRFTVGELGFGTGLNIAALLTLWIAVREPGARLRVFTIEADPLSAAEAGQALSMWPELAPAASLMTERWPGKARGFHRIDLPEFAATVDVAIMEAQPALEGWRGAADAWFLDGFAPALNPDIWRDAVLRLVALRSAPGARAATYTVAGTVRRGLEAAGFTVTRASGHGRKRERLEASLPGMAVDRGHPTVAIIGAGLAGAALSRAFRDHGIEALVVDAVGPGAGASGGPVGLMAPRLDAGLGPAAALFAQAARRAARLYEGTPRAIVSRGALQLPVGPKDARRFAAIAASDLFEPGTMSAAPGPELTGEGLSMGGALVVRPGAVLNGWLGVTIQARVATLQPTEAGWRLLDEGGGMIAEAEVVCVAAAMGSPRLTPDVAMTPVRGQASFTTALAWPEATVFGAYVIPMAEGLLFGATHDRDDSDVDERAGDRARNLAAVEAVLPRLARRLKDSQLADWCAIRATTHDYLPLAGPAPGEPPGLWLLTGLGSRGLCLAPLLAEDLAARIVGAASPLPTPLAALTDPGRFAARAARKGRQRL